MAESEWNIEEISREGAHRVWRARIPQDAIERHTSERLAEMAKSIRLPGFRPGKIPANVMEQRYGGKARAEVVKRLTSEVARHLLSQGNLIAEVKPGEEGEWLFMGTHLPDLPALDPAAIELERLTAEDPAVASALDGHLRQQVLDHLEAIYRFPVAPALVGREFEAIRAMAEQQAERADLPDDVLAQFRTIAERRVRLGAVVAELARRWEVRGADRSQVEEAVILRIVQEARIVTRAATPEELEDLS